MNSDRRPVDRETATAHANLLAASNLTEGEWQVLHLLSLLFHINPDIGPIIRLVADVLEDDVPEGEQKSESALKRHRRRSGRLAKFLKLSRLLSDLGASPTKGGSS